MTETKNSGLNYNLLSVHRSKIMGFAMLLVVFFHSTINFNYLSDWSVVQKAFNVMKYIGNCGVDIFLFMSGIGMYFSWDKTKDTRKFYKSRFSRIVPTYFPIIFILSWILYKEGKIDFLTYILDITATRVWFNKGFLSWYISAIILLYLMVPVFMKHYQKYKNKALIVYLFGACLLNLVCQIPSLNYLRIFVSRIPIFIIGIKFGEMSFYKREVTKEHIKFGLILLIIGFISLVFFYGVLLYDNRFYSIEKYSYFLIVIPMSVILSYFFEKIKSTYELRFLTFIGGLTLEIYAIHERLLLHILNDTSFFYMFDEYKIIYNIIVIVLTVTISFVFSKFIRIIRIISIKRVIDEDLKITTKLVIR